MGEEPDLPAPKPKDEAGAASNNLPPDVSIKPVRTSNWTRLIAIMLVLLFFLAIAAAAYWLFIRKDTAATGSGQPTKPADATQLPANPSGNANVSTTTKHYDSTAMNLGFDYPDDWTVKEAAGLITATSPTTTLTDAAGQQVSGQIVFAVRAKGQVPAEFGSGNAVAVLASQKIAYSQPTDVQRANTYISFVRYANSPPASLDAVYVTGDFGYKVGQAVPKTDIAKADPLVNLTFKQCADASCSGDTTPLALSSAAWENDDFSDPLASMLKSLSVS